MTRCIIGTLGKPLADTDPASEQSHSHLRAEYDLLAPLAEQFREELVRQIEVLVDRNGIQLGFPIESRVKPWDSMSSKFERVSLRLNSIRELQDLVGVRAILLFRRDVEKFSELVSKTFTVLKHEDVARRLREDQFGYSSIHFVIRMPKEWCSVPTLVASRDFTAELQVRTVSQHIWAAASHVLQYKREANVPASLRRSIHRVSALLETVDLELERVLAERDKYRSAVDLSSTELLNADSLEKLLDLLLPPKNKGMDENYAVLLEELSDFGINTVGQLRQILTKRLEDALQEDKSRVERLKDIDVPSGDTKERVIQKGVFYLHVGLVRVVMEKEFGRRWTISMLRTDLKLVPKGSPVRANMEAELRRLEGE